MIHTFQDLVNSLPEEVINGKLLEELKRAYEFEVERIGRFKSQAHVPQVVLLPFTGSGTTPRPQFISNFWVNDLSRPKTNQFNWHAQNTSQWLYAGCIMIQDGQVSTHH